MLTPALIALAGVLFGAVLSHFLAVRSQQLAWEREDARRLQTRENAERIDFVVEVRFVARHGDAWLVELAALLDNKGLVRYETDELTFDLRCIYPDDPLTAGGSEINRQTLIPHVVTAGSWLPTGWGGTFIEPGLSTRYSFITAVPASAVAVLLHGRFLYKPGNEERFSHTAETFEAMPA